jgi:hypothetical protein
MLDNEKRIREQRTIEAVRDNLMGMSGKLGCICRFMGEPIRDHTGSGLVDSRNLDAPWYDERFEDDSFIPTEEIDKVRVIGWFFDGLSSGVHMEIKYTDLYHELSVRWKGYLVYQEMSGQLMAFVPQPDWKTKVEELYKMARKREQSFKKVEQEEEKATVEESKKSWLQEMLEKWGLK